MIFYPAQIDTSANLPPAIDNVTTTNASVINALRDAIIAIEMTLGVVPQGIYTTVRTRLDALESAFLSSGGFLPGGDLSGSGSNQIVIGLQTRPISPTAPTTGQVLKWNGAAWAPATASGGNVLVYRKNEPSPSGNVYATWTAVMAARAAIPGPVTIVIDASLVGGVATVDAGTWDLTADTAIVGIIGGTASFLCALEITSGALLLNPYFIKDLFVVGNSTSVCIDTGGSFSALNLDCYNVAMGSFGSAPLINATPQLNIALYGKSFLLTGTAPAIGESTPGTFNGGSLYVNDESNVNNASISFTGSGPLSVFISGVASQFNTTGQIGTFEYYNGQNVLVYQPGGAGSGQGNVYSSWPVLMSTRSNIQGTVTILVDDRFGSANVDAGTYSLANTTLVGIQSSSTLFFQPSAFLSAIWTDIRSLRIDAEFGSIITLTSSNITMGPGSSLSGDGGIVLTTGAGATVNFTLVGASLSSRVLDVAATGILFILADKDSGISNNVAPSIAGNLYISAEPGCIIGNVQGTQTHITTVGNFETTQTTNYQVDSQFFGPVFIQDGTIYADTSGGAWSLQLNTLGPAPGRRLRLIDKANTFGTNPLTVLQIATEKINGVASSFVINENGYRGWIDWDGTDWYITPMVSPAPLHANNTGSPYSLAIYQSTVYVDVSGGAVSLTMPTGILDGFKVNIKNSNGDASVNNITINAPSIESITLPGTYGASATINIKSTSVTWQYDATLTRWMIV